MYHDLSKVAEVEIYPLLQCATVFEGSGVWDVWDVSGSYQRYLFFQIDFDLDLLSDPLYSHLTKSRNLQPLGFTMATEESLNSTACDPQSEFLGLWNDSTGTTWVMFYFHNLMGYCKLLVSFSHDPTVLQVLRLQVWKSGNTGGLTKAMPPRSPCCSLGGWCGLSLAHCDCRKCLDFRKVTWHFAGFEMWRM